MTSREDQVLKPRDPSLEDENEWEEFGLTDVKILIPGKSRYANLLATSPENPVRVIGSLNEVQEEQRHLVLDDDYISKRIVIENVTHYAYGQHADGEIGVWVAGQAGWYSIVPAKGYRPMHNDMVEAVDLLYFLVDQHRNLRPRRKRRRREPTFEDLCDEYVNHTHGICEDGDDSAEVFYKHHSFLLSQMIQGKEDVQWNETDIFNHLAKKFSDEYERILSLQQQQQQPQQQQQQKPDDGHTFEKNHDAPSNLQIVNAEAISNAQADTIFGIITDLKAAGALAKRQLNLDLVVSTLRSRYEIDSEEYARDLVIARSELVLERMDQADFEWPKKAIYRELKQAAEDRADVRQIAITPLRPRMSLDKDSSSEDDDDDDDDNSPRARRRRMRLSVLRPKLTSVSTKKAGKKTRGSTTVATTADDAGDITHLSEDSDAGAEDLETPSKTSRGHNLVRDPPPSATPINGRARSIALSDADSTSLVIRKTALQETQQSANLSGPEAAGNNINNINNNSNTSHIDNHLPEDTWTCSVQGCGKVIPKASSKRSKELIGDHTLTHAEDTQTKLNLVFAEQRLNVNIGVDHLLRRIREFGSLDGVAADGSDVAAKRVRR